MRSRFLALAITVFALGLDSAADPSASTALSVERPVISQKGKLFDPVELTVPQRGEVLFRNDDPVTHNVFSRTEGSQFNLKMQKPGQEDIVKFELPGDVIVRCAIHPTMKLTIHVEGE